MGQLKRFIVRLAPLVIIAVYIGNSLDSDTAALAMGIILGLFAALIIGILVLMWRDGQKEKARREAIMAQRPPATSQQWIVGEWREVRDPKQIAEPAGRALVPYNTTTKEVAK